jgi:hypothetical protein
VNRADMTCGSWPWPWRSRPRPSQRRPGSSRLTRQLAAPQPALSQLFPVFCHTRGLPPDREVMANKVHTIPFTDLALFSLELSKPSESH